MDGIRGGVPHLQRPLVVQQAVAERVDVLGGKSCRDRRRERFRQLTRGVPVVRQLRRSARPAKLWLLRESTGEHPM